MEIMIDTCTFPEHDIGSHLRCSITATIPTKSLPTRFLTKQFFLPMNPQFAPWSDHDYPLYLTSLLTGYAQAVQMEANK